MSVPVRCYSVDSMNNIDQQPIGVSGHGLPSSSSSCGMMMMMEDDCGDDHRPMMRMSPPTTVHVSDREMHHDQRMSSEEGRLGTPDAADGVLLAPLDVATGNRSGYSSSSKITTTNT